MSSTDLVGEVLDAHGRLDRWRAARTIEAHVRSGGLLPRTRIPGNRFADYRLTVEVPEQRTVMDPFPRDGRRGVFDRGDVRIEDDDGAIMASRSDPRSAFSGLSGLRRSLRWDALDSAYFAGYAMWNYLTWPYLLTREGVEVREGESWTADGERWRRLEVTFPGGLHTHSRSQTFYIDDRRLIRRHDYTAEPVGRWANAALLCTEHREVDGLTFPTRRRVVPRGPRNRALPFPTLVWIRLDEISVSSEVSG